MSADPTDEVKAHQPAFVYAAEAGHGGGKDATLPPDPPAPPTATFSSAQSNGEEPSFSSLVGMPQGVPGTPGFDAGDVVPFGDETIDFAPPLVPGYEILKEVGRGGMGVVYKAQQLSLNRPVALKMILAGSHAGPTERERFRREAAAVATLQNPHIVQIFEIGEANGHLYLALEFVDGGSLAQHLIGNSWPAREAAELIEILARAVHYAHNNGIVHRDLKPGNILLSAERGTPNSQLQTKADHEQTKVDGKPRSGVTRAGGRDPRPSLPKITDFGLAKRLGDTAHPDGTKTGAVMGTPSYIAPEQAGGKARDVGPAADVYALGAILYELLTDRPPFTGETALETVLQVLHDDPVPPRRLLPGIPRDLETICLKCLEKSPAKRYASADLLADDLRRYLTGEPIKARPLSAWGWGIKWARRHPSLALLGTFAISATIALVSVLSIAYAQVRDAVGQMRDAVTQKEQEAEAAREARAKEILQRERAEKLATEAEKLAADNEKGREEAVKRNEELKREAERTRRAAFALQLAQIAAMCERDPRRSLAILDDEARCPADLRDFTWAYLRRLCQREERTYVAHQPNDPLYAVAYSPTGTFVATAGGAGQVRVWDPRSGRTWAILTGNTGRIRGVAFSPDGEVIATAGADHVVRLWALPVDMLAAARKAVAHVPFLDAMVKPLALPPSVILADAHAGEVTCVAFSPDGRFLVSGGEDGQLRWWKLGGWHGANPDVGIGGGLAAVSAIQSQAQLSPEARPVWSSLSMPMAHAGAVQCVAFAAGGDVLVSGGADRLVKVWAPDGASLIRTLQGHADAVLAVAVTPDGKHVATVNNGSSPTIRLISIATGRDVRRFTGHVSAIYALAISGDGELLASTGFDKTVRLWGLEDGQERGLLLGHEQRVSGVAFAPDRRTLISAGMDGTARIWQTTARPYENFDVNRDVSPIFGLIREVSPVAVALSATGKTIVTGDDQGRVHAYRSAFFLPGADPGPTPFRFVPVKLTSPARGPVLALITSLDGRVVLASTADAIFVWRFLHLPGRPGLDSPLALNRPVPLQTSAPVHGMSVDPSGRWLATRDEGGVRLWDLQSIPHSVERLDQLVEPQGPGLILRMRDVRDVVFHPLGDKLAIAVGSGVQVIDRSGKLLASLPTAHTRKIQVIAFGGKHGELLATGDEEGLVKVWRVSDQSELTFQGELAGHTGPVESLAFSPDCRTLASGGYDRMVLLWDPVSGQERAVLNGHADRVLRIQFLPDSSALITVSRDGVAKRWRAESNHPQQSLPRPPTAAGGG